ncbi:phosphatase PAP2 family protein [Azonexus caeni]|jgi:undecaprenyl-diphosphatase|uniref:phosphatase PAP2 family protein n=1 Tax=Azonexus caeni TaxID=266126 RepID=UPI003A8B0644
MDGAWLSLMHAWQHPLLTSAMSAVTWLGSLAVLLPLAAGLAWYGPGNGRQRLFLPLTVLGAAGLAQILKWLIDRERPDLFPALAAMPADASFPSAHAMQVTACVTAWLLWRERTQQAGALAIGIALVGLVAVSRTYLQVHFLSDILAGVVLGFLWSSLCYRLAFWRWSGRCDTNS